jgi:hypothetical protein
MQLVKAQKRPCNYSSRKNMLLKIYLNKNTRVYVCRALDGGNEAALANPVWTAHRSEIAGRNEFAT